MAEEAHLEIPYSTIYKPTYAHDLYKLPAETIKYWQSLDIKIGRCLGEGAFAAAYEGEYGPNANLPEGKTQYRGKDFAVKVIHIGFHPYVPGFPNKDKIDDETRRELDFANRKDIIHPNIIDFHFTGQYPPDGKKNPVDHVFIFMKKALFPFQDLLNYLIKKRARVPSSNGLKWIVGMINAVKHLHSINIIHADLHTYNIFVTGDSTEQIGNSFRFKNIDTKIADFGKSIDISKETEDNKSKMKNQEMERLCLAMIPICEKIAFSDDIKRKIVNSLNQVYQKTLSVDNMLQFQTFQCPQKLDEWTIFVTQ